MKNKRVLIIALFVLMMVMIIVPISYAFITTTVSGNDNE